MAPLTIIFIAVGLSMDAFAVAVSSGLAMRQMAFRHALKIALSFGIFQALMPVAGWLAGLGLRDFIGGIDHWIAFALLSTIGAKMIIESRKIGENEKTTDPTNNYVLLVLSVATSIDALAVGLSLSLIKVAIITPAIIIGVITFSISFAGIYIGKKVGHFFERYVELAGGLILIGIGIKILVEHLK